MLQLTALMSVYNGEKHIEETIKSVLDQSFKDFEFVIVNDGSTDNTLEILKTQTDSRLKIYSFKENQGIPTALNYGINNSSGKYIVKIDGDDIQHHERFEKQLLFMTKNPEIVLSKTLLSYFPDDSEVEKSHRYLTFKKYIENYKNSSKTMEDIATRLKWYCCISHSTMMIRKEIIKNYRYRNLPIFEDYDLFYRMNEDGLKMGHLEENLVRVRLSNYSTTTRKEKSLFDEYAYLIKEKSFNSFKKNEFIFIWGAGEFGRSVLNTLMKKGWRIRGFIDSDVKKEGTLIDGNMTFSPAIIDNSKKNKVIIASQPGMFEIIDFLKGYNYQSELDFMVIR
ncbi:glycosyltransferase [Lederbergia citri]|uniref:Glycosyltransferase n=1 Tax=Lederbergia citri TaxID=2833580 RepID=A0A942TG24_9BACI|nr:glycosyltransferase [Lederbergia citri]MBS4195494.1 glycosyltransferase [Lederbergia citri]